MRAWIFQDHRQKQKLGDKTPWSVGWIDPNGKRKSKRIGSKSQAEKFQRKIEGQLAAGTYEMPSRKGWKEFREEHKEKILPRLAADSQRLTKTGLDHFERLVKPQKVGSVKTQTIDEYVVARQGERGKKPESKVSPATINRELRHLKAVLRVAHDWGYLPKLPKVRFLHEEEHIGPVITPAHFELIYDECDSAVRPEGLACSAGDWWRALLVFAITTGWRIEEICSFRCSDLDVSTGAILTRAGDNKGRRDDLDYLPPVALDHVRKIVGNGPFVFLWPHAERDLWTEFQRVQKAAGIHLVCPNGGKHKCTPSCHVYGFHALRRAYATLNADTMPAAVLQKKMRHRSFTTTLRYISLADKMKNTADQVHVPEFLKKQKPH